MEKRVEIPKKKLIGKLFEEKELEKTENYYTNTKDKKGHKKWTGAFTGGFTAGYRNTVGSKKGWNPINYKSSIKKRKKINQDIFQIMDEEDFEEIELNENFVKNKKFKTFGFLKNDNDNIKDFDFFGNENNLKFFGNRKKFKFEDNLEIRVKSFGGKILDFLYKNKKNKNCVFGSKIFFKEFLNEEENNKNEKFINFGNENNFENEIILKNEKNQFFKKEKKLDINKNFILKEKVNKEEKNNFEKTNDKNLFCEEFIKYSKKKEKEYNNKKINYLEIQKNFLEKLNEEEKNYYNLDSKFVKSKNLKNIDKNLKIEKKIKIKRKKQIRISKIWNVKNIVLKRFGINKIFEKNNFVKKIQKNNFNKKLLEKSENKKNKDKNYFEGIFEKFNDSEYIKNRENLFN